MISLHLRRVERDEEGRAGGEDQGAAEDARRSQFFDEIEAGGLVVEMEAGLHFFSKNWLEEIE